MKIFTIICLILISCLLCLSYVSAQDCEFTIPESKIGVCRELITTCSNCSFVNLTAIYYPPSNGTITYLNAAMTKNINNYNYTFCNLNLVGTYAYTVFGNPDGVLTTGNICFSVSKNGSTLSNSQTLLYFIPLFIFGFLVFFLGYRFISSPTVASKSVYFLLTYIIGLLPFTYSIYQLVNDYLPMQTFMINLLYYFFFIVLILTPVVFLICAAYMIVDLLNSAAKKTLVSRGHSESEANSRIKKHR